MIANQKDRLNEIMMSISIKLNSLLNYQHFSHRLLGIDFKFKSINLNKIIH
jgi:hypothetical protein